MSIIRIHNPATDLKIVGDSTEHIRISATGDSVRFVEGDMTPARAAQVCALFLGWYSSAIKANGSQGDMRSVPAVFGEE